VRAWAWAWEEGKTSYYIKKRQKFLYVITHYIYIHTRDFHVFTIGVGTKWISAGLLIRAPRPQKIDLKLLLVG